VAHAGVPLGRAKQQVPRLKGEAGELLEASLREARLLAELARRSARGRGAQAKLRAAGALEQLVEGCGRVAGQIRPRLSGVRISDRLVSLADPDARPIRGRQTEFGYVVQIAAVTPTTRPSARGSSCRRRWNRAPGRDTLLPQTVAEHERLALSPSESGSMAASRPAPRPTRRAARPEADLHIGPPTARLEAHPPQPRPLPHRHRGPHLPAQAQLLAQARPV
jgi:hypothetical protein